jgi:hypothetical protein
MILISLSFSLFSDLYKIAGTGIRLLAALAKLRHTVISFLMSDSLSKWNNLAPTERIFKKFDI